MSEPIKVGDLVEVIHACCTKAVWSPIFTVDNLSDDSIKQDRRCNFCHESLPKEVLADHYSSQGIWGYPLSWIKRIPPFEELTETKEELTA